jgi:type I restriction enzyme S subunit
MNETIPSEWELNNLTEVANVIDSAHQTPVFSSTGYPMVRIGDIKGGEISLENTVYVSKKLFSLLTKGYKPSFNDILMTRVGSYGRSSIVKTERVFCLGQNTVVINPIDIDSDFLYYALNSLSINSQIEDTVGGSSQKSLSLAAIKSLKILHPVIAQQQKIAKILSTVDNLIEKTQTLIDKYTAIKQGMMADLFTRGIDMTTGDTPNSKGGKLRPSVEDAPELYKETGLGWVPKEWEVCSFGDALEYGYLTLIQDGNHGEAYPRSSDFEITGVPFLSAKHIDQFGMINLDKCPKLPESYLTKLRIGFGRKGDVIFAHNATVGPVGIIDSVDSFIASTSTTIHRTGEGVSSIFLFNYMQSIIFQDQVTRVMGQTTRNQVPIGAQKELYLVKPSTAEQADISDALINISKSLKLETELLGKYKLQKKGLMQDLLTGKIRVF